VLNLAKFIYVQCVGLGNTCYDLHIMVLLLKGRDKFVRVGGLGCKHEA